MGGRTRRPHPRPLKGDGAGISLSPVRELTDPLVRASVPPLAVGSRIKREPRGDPTALHILHMSKPIELDWRFSPLSLEGEGAGVRGLIVIDIAKFVCLYFGVYRSTPDYVTSNARALRHSQSPPE